LNLIERIDTLLPQTQCGKCGHPGCKPYAEGIANGEAINKCPPGGDETIIQLAELLAVPVVSLDVEGGTAPAQVAFIREAECIGCTKCIQACPVDAILGAAKLMHTVIIDECTGCDLCVAPCPVDCIEMRPLLLEPDSLTAVTPLVGGLAHSEEQRVRRLRKRNRARQRFESRNTRLRLEQERRIAERLSRAQKPSGVVLPSASAAHARADETSEQEEALKKARIALAMSRAQLNKSLKAFGHPPIREQAARLVELQHEYELTEQALASLVSASPRASAPPAVKVDNSELKRAKIQQAMARAALSKAQSANAPPEQLSQLRTALQQAELAFETAEKLLNAQANVLP